MLEQLCTLRGISGREKNVTDFILDKIKNHCDAHVDNVGNIIAFKKGKKTPAKPIMVDAHTDEVGLIVTYITKEGYLLFEPVGGIDTKILAGIPVLVGDNSVKGVIGAKAIHLLSAEEKEKPLKIANLSIDIGAMNQEEAEQVVSIGDMVTFLSPYSTMGDKICAKALDDRIGCNVMIDLICGEIEYDTTFAFTVQEEVGLRGATNASFAINPTYAIVIDATTASDVCDVSEVNKVCKLGCGAVVSFMDKATIYNKEMFDLTVKVAKEKNIKYQLKKGVFGGNDAGAISKSRDGVKTIAISLPCRYLHSPCCMIDKNDIEPVRELVKNVIAELGNK